MSEAAGQTSRPTARPLRLPPRPRVPRMELFPPGKNWNLPEEHPPACRQGLIELASAFCESIIVNASPCARWFRAFNLVVALLALHALGAPSRLHAAGPPQKMPLVVEVEQQPLVSATRRVVDALKFVGAPLKEEDKKALEAAWADPDEKKSIRKIQEILDPYCLVAVTINPESRVSAVEGPAAKELIQQGWRTFLVKVVNQAGITPVLRPESPNLGPVYLQGHGARERPLDGSEVGHRAGRGERPVAGARDVRQAAAQARAVGVGRGVSHRLALQPRSREAGGGARVQRGGGDAGFGVSQQCADPVRLSAGGEGRAGRQGF